MTTMLYSPGEEVPVYIEDGGDGLPGEGDVVEIVGENDALTRVTKVQSQGNEGIGVLSQVPSDDDGNAVAGQATVILGKPVVTVTETSEGALSAGDEVQEDDGGTVIGFDGAGTPTSTPLGQCFAAAAGKYGFGRGGEVAVALYR